MLLAIGGWLLLLRNQSWPFNLFEQLGHASYRRVPHVFCTPELVHARSAVHFGEKLAWRVCGVLLAPEARECFLCAKKMCSFGGFFCNWMFIETMLWNWYNKLV
uniref:Putative secreted protein n=1 Tax=Ixodes scapularis TaxID=6945 RepID=A0A4D5S259_IXOSC